MGQNPFSDATPERERARNPFGEEIETPSKEERDPAATLEYSAARIRRLRSLVGSEGLTLSATRELLDHLATALDAAARGLRD